MKLHAHLRSFKNESTRALDTRKYATDRATVASVDALIDNGADSCFAAAFILASLARELHSDPLRRYILLQTDRQFRHCDPTVQLPQIIASCQVISSPASLLPGVHDSDCLPSAPGDAFKAGGCCWAEGPIFWC